MRHGRLIILFGIALAVAGCGGGSSDTQVASDEDVPTAVAPTTAPTATTAPPTPEPTPLPTATPPPIPTATPPPPTATPTPTVEPVFQESLEEIRALAGLTEKGLGYDEFVELTDETGLISVTVPASWTDIDGTGWIYDDEDGVVGLAITASPSIEAFLGEWGTPGVFIGASNALPFTSPEEMLEEFWFGDSCTHLGTRTYDDGAYVGLVDVYIDCGEEESLFLQIIAGPEDGSYLIEAQMLAPTDHDLDAIFLAIDSFTAMPAAES